MFIYSISNNIDNKLYIGSTKVSLLQRWQFHLIELEKGNRRNLYVHMRNLGFENFAIIILAKIDSLANNIKLEMFEQLFIDLYPKSQLLNMQRAYDTRTQEQKRADQKLYYQNKRNTVTCPQCGHAVDITYMDKHIRTISQDSVNPIVAPAVPAPAVLTTI